MLKTRVLVCGLLAFVATAVAAAAAGCGDNVRPELCGNGRLDPPEACDPGIQAGQAGACSATCDDTNACTDDAMSGSAAACSLVCTHTAIAGCGGGGPCGNGVVDNGETCDIGIPAGSAGACPTSADCNDNMACTTDAVTGVGCAAACANTAITAAGPIDLCCPAGADSGTDPDCPPTCGNGVLDLGELCDTALPATDPSACPTTCNDSDACTTDTLISGGTCSAACSFVADVPAADGDGCCPAGANANTDTDCSAVCGNGALEPGENCDAAIPTGLAGSCPTALADCDDGDSCTDEALVGFGCITDCTHAARTAGTTDLCCPAGANANTDPDCLAVCGNGVIEAAAGEDCDIASAGSCPATAADCDDTNACTTDSAAGTGCGRHCEHAGVLTCSMTVDGCCPPGCTGLTDGDCSLTCGDNIVQANETCDTGATSPTPCPATAADCADGDSCTTDDVQSGGTCNAVCVHATITALVSGDGCCPARPRSEANNNTDTDCPVVCDDGNLETGETCDPLSACPTVCNDGDACTTDFVADAGTCQAACSTTDIVPCCGNGVREGSETCDPNAPPGPDACPTSCPATCTVLTGTAAACTAACTAAPAPCCGDGVVTDPVGLTETCDDGPGSTRTCASITCNDGIACTSDTPLNLGGNACRKICPHQAINDAAVSDSCCPPQSRFGDDIDCVCGGLGVNSPLEVCDDGNAINNDACSNSCTFVDGPDPDTDPTVADVVGAPCTGPGSGAGNCSYASSGSGSALPATCITNATLPPFTNGVVNGYCSSTFCDPNTADDAVDTDLVPENIDTCPQIAPLSAIQMGLAAPNAVCADIGAGIPICLALCSPAAGQNLCRRTELGPLSAVLGATLGGWAYRCQPISPTAGICVPRDPTF